MDNGCNLHYKPRTPITAFKHEVLATLEICQNKDDGKLTKKKSNKKNRAIAFKTTKRGSFFFPSFVCPPQVFRWMVRLMLQAGSLSLTQLYPSKLKEPSFHRSAFTHSVNHSFSWWTLKFLKGSRKQLPFCNLSSKITN